MSHGPRQAARTEPLWERRNKVQTSVVGTTANVNGNRRGMDYVVHDVHKAAEEPYSKAGKL